MNLVLLEASDFVAGDCVRLTGRRLEHVRKVHRAEAGDELRVGVVGGQIGRGRVERMDDASMEMAVALDRDPPPPLPLRLILALPRPKVLNRTIAAAASLGIKEIDIVNSWRVEKSYWKSPRLSGENLRAQCVLGLEQAVDTVLPVIRQHRLLMEFMRGLSIEGRLGLVAHPYDAKPIPRVIDKPVTLAIGPEGGFIDREVESFREAGFQTVSLGPRILRVETALPAIVAKIQL
jgi:16S rRNA (uracil1498-N3)-methyltransferase